MSKKKMKILLLDIDSKIPNLALMKISAYNKRVGNDIIFNFLLASHDADQIYMSVIFTKNLSQAKSFDITGKAIIGGSGTGNYSLTLPDEIEHIMPDYDLYNASYSMGFTTRGCLRKCPFCIIPKKEGNIRPVADIYEFWDQRHDTIILLDNNILAATDHFFKITEQLKQENLKVDFNQGLDFRLLTDEICQELKSVRKIKGRLRFAFDSITDTQKVEAAIDMLKKYELNQNLWYVLTGFNSTFEEDLQRLELLRKYNQRAYVMRYGESQKNKKLIQLARWANQPHLFAKMDFNHFLKVA